jgi:hypothetical protein
MGHTWREIDPAGAAQHDVYWDRVHKLREAFKDVSLGEFTVGELPLIVRLQSLEHNSAGTVKLYEPHLKALEEKLKKIGTRK